MYFDRVGRVLGRESDQLEAAQVDVWGAAPTTLLSTSVAPIQQEVARVPGGYQLRGRWGFSSGCDHATWVIVSATLPPETDGAEAEPRWLLLGETDAGRQLTLIFTRRGNRIRPISCRPMRRNERRLYEEAKLEGGSEEGQ